MNMVHKLWTLLLLVFSYCTLVIGLESVCQWNSFSPECGPNQVVIMDSAYYGRMTPSVCIDNTDLGCAVDVLDIAHRRCSARRSCQIDIPSEDLERRRPCGDKKNFFQGSYRCQNVVGTEYRQCDAATCNHVTLREPSGYIANEVSLRTRCGSVDCPWIIEAQPGQHVVISLYDYSEQHDASQGAPEICKVYAVIGEPANHPAATVCSGYKDSNVVYTSVGHQVEVRVHGTIDDPVTPYFLLHYQAAGCADPAPPIGGTLRRDGDVAFANCPSDNKRWRLDCNGTHWIGSYKNCTTSSHDDTSSGSSSLFSFTYAETIAIIIAIAIVIGVLTVTIGIICLRRTYQTPHLNPAMSLGYPKEDSPYNSVAAVPYYHAHQPNALHPSLGPAPTSHGGPYNGMSHDYQEVADTMTLRAAAKMSHGGGEGGGDITGYNEYTHIANRPPLPAPTAHVPHDVAPQT